MLKNLHETEMERIINKRAAAKSSGPSSKKSAVILVNGTVFVFFAVFRVAGKLHLRILHPKLLPAELADVAVIGNTEKSAALVVQIVTTYHGIPPFLKKY